MKPCSNVSGSSGGHRRKFRRIVLFSHKLVTVAKPDLEIPIWNLVPFGLQGSCSAIHHSNLLFPPRESKPRGWGSVHKSITRCCCRAELPACVTVIQCSLAEFSPFCLDHISGVSCYKPAGLVLSLICHPG